MLGELTGLGPFFAIRAHPRGTPPVPPWRPVTDLTGPSRVLRARIGSVRAVLATRGGLAATDVEPRVAASAVHLGMVARMTAPALGAAVLGCPLLRTERHPPGPAFRRSSCCLCYRLAPGTTAAVCGDCVLATVRQPDCGP